MNSAIFGLYGASGFGQEVMFWLKRQVNRDSPGSDVVFVDDGSSMKELDGCAVLSYEAFLSRPEDHKFCTVAIAGAAVRQKLDEKLDRDGVRPLTILGDYSFIRGATVSDGAFVSAYVDITSNVRIGRCFHANTYSYVGHDCVIGNYVTFAPKVACNGNVHIHDHAYIGTGAILKQGTPEKPLVIGRGAVVGMGAVVTRDVPPGVTVVGNPARVLDR